MLPVSEASREGDAVGNAGSGESAVGRIDVRYVAHLARLELTDEEVRTFQGQLDQIVAYVRKISELDVRGIEPTAHAVAVQNVLRKDEMRPGMDRETALRNAPETTGELIRVPKIVE